MDRFDIAIVGAGIVGLATAHRLAARHPDRSVAILECRGDVGTAQSGRNSGVVHSGIYYTPGSLKAHTCRRGRAMLREFCLAHGVPLRTCGKLIVATTPRQTHALEHLERRAVANGVRATRLSPEQASEIEPHVRITAALHVPETGVVDFSQVCHALARSLTDHHRRIALNARATRVREESGHVVIDTEQGQLAAGHLIACAGLQADRLARASGLDPGVRIVPFKGRYCTLRPDAAHLCAALIYPVPDPRFPFLGAHFTRRIDGVVEVGPTAAPALTRGHDRGLRALGADLRDSLGTRGLWALALRHSGTALAELYRTASRDALAAHLRAMVPDLRARDLLPTTSGIRAQALRADGSLVDDFAIVESRRMLHVCNAPSPAATACLAIGDRLVNMLEERLGARSRPAGRCGNGATA